MKISKMKILTGWVAMTLVIAFTSVGVAGTLEPPGSAIDSGTGEPKPTMKTLDSIPGTWDRLLDSSNGDPTTGCNSDRFICIFPNTGRPDGDSVRDNETGLVWKRFLSGSRLGWIGSVDSCLSYNGGGRLGWRLPRIEELASLFYGEGQPLPAGHPFSFSYPVNSTAKLHSISNAINVFPTGANLASVDNKYSLLLQTDATGQLSLVEIFKESTNGSEPRPSWCVRGGSGVNLDYGS